MPRETAPPPLPGSEKWTATAEEEGVRLDVAVASRLRGSRAQAKRWIEQGLVRVAGRSARPSRLVHAGESIEVTVPPPLAAEPRPEPIPLRIVYENGDLIVVDKPAGMVVHPSPGHLTGTLVHALLHHSRDLSGIGGVARPGIVHRLDRGTSGLIVAAKNDHAHRSLARQFQTRTVEKEYLALVQGVAPRQLSLRGEIGRDIRHRQKISSRTRRGREATTEAELLESLPGSSLLRVRIRTGRTHQIRVQLSEAGFPVVGDLVYGRRRARTGDAAARVLGGFGRPALHASRLRFRHPTSEEVVELHAPLPSDMAELVETLRSMKR